MFSQKGDVAKARWVVCGNFEDKDSGSHSDTYAALAASTALKIFLTHSACQGLHNRQFDVGTAFLNAAIPDGITIYVDQPQDLSDSDNLCPKDGVALHSVEQLRRWLLYPMVAVKRALRTLSFLNFIGLVVGSLKGSFGSRQISESLRDVSFSAAPPISLVSSLLVLGVVTPAATFLLANTALERLAMGASRIGSACAPIVALACLHTFTASEAGLAMLTTPLTLRTVH